MSGSALSGIVRLPLLVILTGLTALAMYLPAIHAAVLRDHQVARPFFYGGTVFLLLAVMVGIAVSNRRNRSSAGRDLAALLGAYLWLPLVMAVPFDQAVPDTSYFNAWWEMLSSFTTTGATLYDRPGRLPPSLHLWRALAGWLGGFFVLLSVAAILAPLGLGGAEVTTARNVHSSAGSARGGIMRGADLSTRLPHFAGIIFPAYVALTLLLWVILLGLGGQGLVSLILAMSTLSTSGITMVGGLARDGGGIVAETVIFAFLMLSVTRRSLPGPTLTGRSRPVWQDPEIRLALFLLLLVPGLLVMRHWIGALSYEGEENLATAARAFWGAVFTTLSFLTTTGFESADWQAAQAWSGLRTPGLILVGLAMMGGGIATATGGLKLLRIYALARHGERELGRLVYPSSVEGGGRAQRQLRQDGAYMAWIFFMLNALAYGGFLLAFALAGLDFDRALIMTISMVTTTGPLSQMGAEQAIPLLELSAPVKLIAAAAMVLGRMEVLALIALLAPGTWRR
ncbi:potassium transporter TrkG [Szabonella alba]|uniref:TrkH family potassium uptake protein n=1 Tax=Szabonella alba TaxID=2804194 RepID=A0A8K0Y0K7_9RHOB|nr:potassium transporter TrkG [Szabonella alba]MBL4917223.1 TrkH family potassium uptake protein [Szabonella alba]